MAINVLSEQGFSAPRFGHEIGRSKSHIHQKKLLTFSGVLLTPGLGCILEKLSYRLLTLISVPD